SPGCRPGSRPSVEPGGTDYGVLLGLLENLDHAPPLGGRQRAGLHDQHPVADAAVVLLVVRLQLGIAPQDLAVEGVLDAVLDGDHDGLVHLVADHQALADLAAGTLLRHGFLTHAAPSLSDVSAPGVDRIPSSRSRTTV